MTIDLIHSLRGFDRVTTNEAADLIETQANKMTELEKAAREAISVLNKCYFTIAGGCERAEVIDVIRQLEAALSRQDKQN